MKYEVYLDANGLRYWQSCIYGKRRKVVHANSADDARKAFSKRYQALEEKRMKGEIRITTVRKMRTHAADKNNE